MLTISTLKNLRKTSTTACFNPHPIHLSLFKTHQNEPCDFEHSRNPVPCYTFHMIEPSIALYGEAFAKVTASLDELLTKAHVRYAMLVDRKGFVLAHREALWAPKPPTLDSIATLIAGNAAATSALAKLLGERRFNELVHQGERIGLYVEEISDEGLLVVIFDETAPIGRVKLFAKKSIEEIGGLIDSLGSVETTNANLGNDFALDASALLDDLFKGM
jgi:predicted regulator of Ras-like GTPase activity (Roadblock/LC7/MglB family)